MNKKERKKLFETAEWLKKLYAGLLKWDPRQKNNDPLHCKSPMRRNAHLFILFT